VARRVRAGEELGPVMDDVLGESNVAKKMGAAGVLTDGIVDREKALAGALAGALGPFVTDRY
jgi:non-canonical (house-cleaning) NTP pyrophosphatase